MAENDKQAQQPPQMQAKAPAPGLPVGGTTDTGNSHLDEAPEGGRYIVNGETVDANGNPIKDAPKAADGADKKD